MARDRNILVANTNAAIVHDGQSVMLHRGRTHVRAGHPILAGREHMFEQLHVDYDVEQATAAPGEKRSVTLPAVNPPASAVRAWAAEHGIDVPAQGRLSTEIVAQYQADVDHSD